MRHSEHVPSSATSSTNNRAQAHPDSSASSSRLPSVSDSAVENSRRRREEVSTRRSYATRNRVTQGTRRSTPESEDIDMTEDEDDDESDDMSQREASGSSALSTPPSERDDARSNTNRPPHDTATNTTATTTIEQQPRASTSSLDRPSASTPSSPTSTAPGSQTPGRPNPSYTFNRTQYPAYDMYGGRVGLQATLHGKEPEKKGSYYRLRTHFYPAPDANAEDEPHVMSFDLNRWHSEPPESEPPSPPPPGPSGSGPGGSAGTYGHGPSSLHHSVAAPTPRPTGRPHMGPDPNFRGQGSRATTPEIRYILGMRPDDPVSLRTLRDPAPGQKPNYPYPTLITLAIHESPRKSLTLQEIYQALEERFEWYREHPDDKSWHNSIRHNLSLNKRFRRVTRNLIEGGKGCRWVVDLSGGEGNKRPRKRNKPRKAAGSTAVEQDTTTPENASNDASPVPAAEDYMEDMEMGPPHSPGIEYQGLESTSPPPPPTASGSAMHGSVQTSAQQVQQVRRDGDASGGQARTVIGSSHWTPYYPYAITAPMPTPQDSAGPRRPFDTTDHDRPFVPDIPSPTSASHSAGEESSTVRPGTLPEINPAPYARQREEQRPTLQSRYNFEPAVDEPPPAPPSPPPPPTAVPPTHTHVCPTCGTTTPGRLWPVSLSSAYHHSTTPIEPIPTSTRQPLPYSSNPSSALPSHRPSVPTQQITLSHTTRPIPPPPPPPPTLTYLHQLQPTRAGQTSGEVFASTSRGIPSSSSLERGRRPRSNRDVYTDSRGNVYPKRGRNVDYSSDSSDD